MLTSFYEIGTPKYLELSNSASLACWQAPGILLSIPSDMWVSGMYSATEPTPRHMSVLWYLGFMEYPCGSPYGGIESKQQREQEDPVASHQGPTPQDYSCPNVIGEVQVGTAYSPWNLRGHSAHFIIGNTELVFSFTFVLGSQKDKGRVCTALSTSIKTYCLCAHLHVYAFVQVCAHSYMCTKVWKIEISFRYSPWLLITLFVETGSLTELLSKLDWLLWPQKTNFVALRL